jgi:Cysteine dioxygenase type I
MVLDTALTAPELDECSVPGLSPRALAAIASGLARTAHLWPGIAGTDRRTWDLMASGTNFEAWVISWPAGGSIDLHDHGPSAGAVTVARGRLYETTLITEGGTVSPESRVVESGQSVTFGTDYIHDFVNVGPQPALSVHVYSPRLTAMSYFDLVEGRLELSHTARCPEGSAIP